MSLSLIAKSIKASPTLKLNEKFAILKEKGDPVIHLGGGEPKTKVPMDAILATVAHANTGEVRLNVSLRQSTAADRLTIIGI